MIWLGGHAFMARQGNTPPASTASTTSFTNTVTTRAGVTFGYDAPYGLATTPEQVLVKAYIPPCSEGFDYCLYRATTTYAGTNFESAGLSIRTRSDLSTKTSCLTTPPEGYAGLTATTSEAADYATSVFAPLGDAGAGHYASGALYRLFAKGSCTEFETRLGETQFANYPEGSIREFTDADRAAVKAEFAALLASVTLGSSTPVVFPG